MSGSDPLKLVRQNCQTVRGSRAENLGILRSNLKSQYAKPWLNVKDGRGRGFDAEVGPILIYFDNLILPMGQMFQDVPSSLALRSSTDNVLLLLQQLGLGSHGCCT